MNNKTSLKKELCSLEKYDITYISANFEITGYNKKKGKYEKNDVMKQLKSYGDKTGMSSVPKNYIYKKLTTDYNPKANGSVILLGPHYSNLFLFDVDLYSMNNVMQDSFNKFLDDHPELKLTLTLSTVNKGLHLYFYLNEQQNSQINAANGDKYKATTNSKLFGFDGIDLKYFNQVGYGPGFMTYDDKLLKYTIKVDKKPVVMPDFIFNEILKCINLKKNPLPKVQLNDRVNDIPINIINNNLQNDYISKHPLFTNSYLYSKKIKQLRLYLDNLPVLYYKEYDHWLKIAMIIYNECDSLDLLDEYSKKADNYDEVKVRNKWLKDIVDHEFGSNIKTLRDMVFNYDENIFKNLDNKDEYNMLTNMLFSSQDPLSADIAQLFYAVYSNKYLKINEEIMYYLNNSGIYDNTNFEKVIKNDITRQLIKEVTEYYKNFKILNKNTKYVDDKIDMMCNNYTKIRAKLGNNCKELRYYIDDMFLDETADKKLDKLNNNILSFSNGVYDMNKFILRKGTSEDYVSNMINYDYTPSTLENRKFVMNVLQQIMPKEEELLYYLEAICGIFNCGSSQKYYFSYGHGANGKSLMNMLMQGTFGNYVGNLNSCDICQTDKGEKDKNGPNPFIYAIRKSRIVLISELSKGAKLDSEMLKKLTGGELIPCRTLYQAHVTLILAKFLIFIGTNELPKFEAESYANTRRMRMILFLSKFCDNPSSDPKKQEFRMDENLEKVLCCNKYYCAFFDILIEVYKGMLKRPEDYKEEEHMPIRFKEACAIYIEDNNPIKNFIKEYVNLFDTNDINKKEKKITGFKLFNEFESSRFYDKLQFPRKKLNLFYNALVKEGLCKDVQHKQIIFRYVEFKEDDDEKKDVLTENKNNNPGHEFDDEDECEDDDDGVDKHQVHELTI